ncbi:MAG: sensor domain-containing diguanylate cyclase [Nitriliruptoraceae bacterium]|nr:sensor domain-containing diguanylate cyclase [Nitriliruptoraceae bacterium]
MADGPSIPGAVVGVSDPARLAAVSASELEGHAGDRDLDAVVATLQLGCDVPIAIINTVRPDLQTYVAEIGVGAPCTEVADQVAFCAEVVDTGAALTVADAGSHPVFRDNPLVASGVIGAYAGVPLIDDGVVLGTVAMFDAGPRVFTAGELELLGHQAQLASSVLALRRATRTDALTGLPNRALFDDRLVQAVARLDRHDALIALLFLDLDGFKQLNDTRGHGTGDQVLAEVARRFTTAMRPADTLARIGGDEFVAVCEDLVTPTDAEQIAERLIASVADGMQLDGRHVPIAVSIGIAVAGDPAVDVMALMRAADRAMYRAKAQPGSSWMRSSTMNAQGPARTGRGSGVMH